MPERETSIKWRPFNARDEVPFKHLQVVWKYEDDERVEMVLTHYFIGRFPPEYANELIERFECECIEASKGFLKENHLEYIDSIVAPYRILDDEPVIRGNINGYVQDIVKSIEERDKNDSTGNNNC